MALVAMPFDARRKKREKLNKGSKAIGANTGTPTLKNNQLKRLRMTIIGMRSVGNARIIPLRPMRGQSAEWPACAEAFRSASWTTLVAAERVAATAGLGRMVLNASSFLRTDVVVMGIVLIGLIAWMFDLGMRTLEQRLVPWKGRV